MNEPARDIPAIAPTPLGPAGGPGDPRNPTVAYERTDVDTRAVVWFVSALAVGIVAAMTLLVGLYSLFSRTEAETKRSDFPVAAEVRREYRQTDPDKLLPPSPRLEGIAPVSPNFIPGRIRPADELVRHDVGRLRPGSAQELYGAQERELNSWHWADTDHTAARIPIDVAISRMIECRSDMLKARSGKPAGGGRDEFRDQPSGTSSGRVPREGQP